MRIIFDRHLFEAPVSIIKCCRLSEVEACLGQMDAAVNKGFYLAGFLSYEAGYAFEERFHNSKTYDFPLVCFGAFRKPELRPHPPSPSPSGRGGGKLYVDGGEGKKHYFAALRRIKAHLSAGDTYQVNYTFKQKFNFEGDPLQLFQKLKRNQITPYSAFVEADDFSILSLSPELFFRKQGKKITVKPMKGTIGPGRGNADLLKADAKNRSENLMIVDLLRNDLGRIARPGTVKTKKLFEVEKYKTLYQMTSTIEADIPEKIDLYSLFSNIFPSGSVTGAPKVRTMQIIKELESEERKIYCGSIGYITPERNMVFNVAIRTILLDPCPLSLGTYNAELGLGSGITYASDPQQEWAECLLKAKFLVG